MSRWITRSKRRGGVLTIGYRPEPGRWLGREPDAEVEEEHEEEPEPKAALVSQGARSEPPPKRDSRRWLRPPAR